MSDFISSQTEVVKVGEPLSNSNAITKALEKGELYKRCKMRGYKGFDSNLKCRNFQYEIGQSYSHDGPVELCIQGFHFCEKLRDCFRYYPTEDGCRFCEVEAWGDIYGDGLKYVAKNIKIIRELSPIEISRYEYGWGYGDGHRYGYGNGNGFGDCNNRGLTPYCCCGSYRDGYGEGVCYGYGDGNGRGYGDTWSDYINEVLFYMEE